MRKESIRNEDNGLAIAEQALRHTEMRLEDLEKNASSAERRLVWFASVTVALGSISFLYAQNVPFPPISYAGGMMFFLVAILSIGIALPKGFHVRGHYWRDWEGYIEDGDDLLSVIISQGRENNDRINTIESELSRTGERFKYLFYLVVWITIFVLSGQFSVIFL